MLYIASALMTFALTACGPQRTPHYSDPGYTSSYASPDGSGNNDGSGSGNSALDGPTTDASDWSLPEALPSDDAAQIGR